VSAQSAYISLFETFPEDEAELRLRLSSLYTTIAAAVNVREIGFYQNAIQTPTGQLFSNATGSGQRDVQRKVFYFGATTTGATTTIAHGLSSITSCTKIMGTACTATDFRPIPYSSVTAATAGIEMKVDATNVYIINGATAPAITSGIAIVECLYT
jgi:hypothetical protein